MGKDFIFSYGAGMNRSALRAWLESMGYDSSLVVGYSQAVLDGYDYVWNYYSSGRGGGTANLEPKENSSVRGVLIEFEDSLLKAFDKKEGHPSFYSRGESRLPVLRLDDNQVVLAWVYLARPNRGDSRDIWPSREYKKIVIAAAVEANFPEEEVEKIKAWKTQS
jgi:hypothetical protein